MRVGTGAPLVKNDGNFDSPRLNSIRFYPAHTHAYLDTHIHAYICTYTAPAILIPIHTHTEATTRKCGSGSSSRRDETARMQAHKERQNKFKTNDSQQPWCVWERERVRAA